MNTTTGRPLGSFEDRLLRDLREVVMQRAQVPQRRLWLRRWSRGAVAGVVLACVSGTAGGLALAGTFNGGTISPQAWVDGQRVEPETTVTPDQTASLGILRRSVVASDALDPYDNHVLTDTPAAANGVNVSLARRAQGFTSGAAWVIPGNSGIICLVAENAQAVAMDSEPGPWQDHTRVAGANGVTGCAADSKVTTGWWAGYGFTRDTPGMDFTGGIVPDGVSQVTVTVADGASTSLPVHDNVWMGSVPGAPASISFDGPSGTVTISGQG
jgi:hypothetical protein